MMFYINTFLLNLIIALISYFYMLYRFDDLWLAHFMAGMIMASWFGMMLVVALERWLDK